MKKDYQILLCENLYDSDTTKFVNTRVCEIGSSSSKFEGKAYDVHLTHNINGTKELTFKLAKYYFDEITGKKVRNFLPDMIVNKCSIEVKIKDKSYFFVVNQRSDEEDGDNITYSFICGDAFIEELSKTGYGLNFSEQTGLGTIHELAEKVVKGTEWKYDKDKSDTVFETRLELEYNKDLMRYDEVEYPVPTHDVDFISELDRYANKLDFVKTITHQKYADYKGVTISLTTLASLPFFLGTIQNKEEINNGIRVLYFSDGSEVRYYHTEESEVRNEENGLTLVETYEIEKLIYYTYDADGVTVKDEVVLTESKIPYKKLKVTTSESKDLSNNIGNARYITVDDTYFPKDPADCNLYWEFIDRDGEKHTGNVSNLDFHENSNPIKAKFHVDGTKIDLSDEPYMVIDKHPSCGERLVTQMNTISSNPDQIYRCYVKKKENGIYYFDIINTQQKTTSTKEDKINSGRPFSLTFVGLSGNDEVSFSRRNFPDRIGNISSFTLNSEDRVILIEADENFTKYFNLLPQDFEPINYAHQLYCYEDSETITTETVQNYIYNGSNFTDTVGWINKDTESYIETEAVDNTDTDAQYDKKYNLKIVKSKVNEGKAITAEIINELCASTNKALEADTPYVFKYRLANCPAFSQGYNQGGALKAIKIYDGNPLVDKSLLPSYENYPTNLLGTKIGYTPTLEKTSDGSSTFIDVYYIVKSKVTITKPYLGFEFNLGKDEKEISIESFSLYPLKGKSTSNKDQPSNADANNYLLLANLYDGQMINDKYYETEEDDTKIYYIDLMVHPEDELDAYTQKHILYFYRENYYIDSVTGETKQLEEELEDTLKYLSVKEILSFSKEEYSTNTKEYEDLASLEGNVNKNYKTREEIEKAERDGNIERDKLTLAYLYYATDEDKYYQYYTIAMVDPISKEERFGSKWDYAFYGIPMGDRVRTYTSEKSNRFNQIQELGELFEAWPVFEMVRNEDNSISKSFHYKVSNIRDNFIGFHKGINLTKLSREIQSDEIITKTYVEDIDANFSTKDGLINIRTAMENPSGENFIYNFKYYVDQKLLNTMYYDEKTKTEYLMIDYDRDTLYANIRSLNYKILDKDSEIIDLNYDISSVKTRLKSLSLQQSSMNESISALEAENNNPQTTQTQKDENNEKINEMKAKRVEYNAEYEKTNKQYNAMLRQLKGYNELRNEYQTQKEDYIHKFENKYSQFIKEGVWTGSNYVDNDSYYYDALKVAATSSMPKVTWNIEVIDNSIQEDYQDFVYEVGDLTFLVDNEFFNVTQEENAYTFKVLISQLEECLDNPSKNKITVQNYTTSFEDLFQRIAAASQNLVLNERVYKRAEGFNADGTIDASILQKTLEDNALVLINSDDNSFNLDENGLFLQSKVNPNKKIRIVSEGIFISNSTNETNPDEPQWKTGITAEGINASVLNTGTINTSVINIMNNGQPHFLWNALGITAHSLKDDGLQWVANNNNFVRFDGFGLYFVDLADGDNTFGLLSNGKPWYTGLATFNEALNTIKSKSSVSITRDGFLLNAAKKDFGSLILGYKDQSKDSNIFGLYIKNKDGKDIVSLQNNGISTIGGWTIEKDALYYSGEEGLTSYKDSKVGMGLQDPNWTFWAGFDTETRKAKFRVDQEGNLFATGADISGIITSKEGTIGGFTIEEDCFTARYSTTVTGTGIFPVSLKIISSSQNIGSVGSIPALRNTRVFQVLADTRAFNWGTAKHETYINAYGDLFSNEIGTQAIYFGDWSKTYEGLGGIFSTAGCARLYYQDGGLYLYKMWDTGSASTIKIA